MKTRLTIETVLAGLLLGLALVVFNAVTAPQVALAAPPAKNQTTKVHYQHGVTETGGTTDIMPTAWTAKTHGAFRIGCGADTQGRLSIIISDGSTELEYNFGSAVQDADGAYTYTWPVMADHIYNFEYSVGADITLSVEFVESEGL